ncbi:MAG TPA: ABC transporter permease subunit, partial [Flavobacteriales bacterium]|nr:ABC transporter permease subunit [Flavobacteriales bacterium]
MALDWQIFCQDTIDRTVVQGCFGTGGPKGTQTYLDWLLQAWGQTVQVAALSLVVALVVGCIVGTVRTLPESPWLTRLANAWVELFRNIPLLVQVFLWYHVVPVLFPAFANVPKLALVVAALGLFTSARIAEQVRAGIQALPRGQR